VFGLANRNEILRKVFSWSEATALNLQLSKGDFRPGLILDVILDAAQELYFFDDIKRSRYAQEIL